MTNLLISWIVRFNQEYLTQQTLFKLYPEELMTFDLKETWRGKITRIKNNNVTFFGLNILKL
jgi:hypothetical protein